MKTELDPLEHSMLEQTYRFGLLLRDSPDAAICADR